MIFKSASEKPLDGMRILVVDDEFLISANIEETLHDAGAEIITSATLSTALMSATETPLSAALLDVRLGRQTTEAVADALAARDIPFAFYSGQTLPDRLRQKYPGAEVLHKPSTQEAVLKVILKVVGH